MSPILPYASLCSRGYLHVIWGCRSPTCLTTPKGEWMPLHVSNMPCLLPSISVYSMGYLHVLGARHFFWGAGDVGMSVRLWCLSVCTLDVHYVHLVLSCSLLCLKFLLPQLHYYSSSDYGVFWYVIYIISDCGSLFDGASYNVGSA